MDLFVLLAIAVGLSMDSFSVAVARGVSKFKLSDGFKMAVAFSIAHFVMIIVGWLCGAKINDFISGVDHWIAFGLLSVVGTKMIFEYFKHGETVSKNLDLGTLLILSLATSIDAFAVGISFAFFGADVWFSNGIITVVIFFMTLIGLFTGRNFGKLIGKKAEIIGGLILIGIGVKTLFGHM